MQESQSVGKKKVVWIFQCQVTASKNKKLKKKDFSVGRRARKENLCFLLQTFFAVEGLFYISPYPCPPFFYYFSTSFHSYYSHIREPKYLSIWKYGTLTKAHTQSVKCFCFVVSLFSGSSEHSCFNCWKSSVRSNFTSSFFFLFFFRIVLPFSPSTKLSCSKLSNSTSVTFYFLLFAAWFTVTTT